ncbi:hypothetical protein AVEN_106603-1 [Araneus ventricosus]|uniref:CCHC-type domain-containing protein n=1 Tax=Araneus ventricosus TaxID=182803 RepID=A0A4Y2IVU3_ARAVE|nr:hypothetical protein AVEN_106603-1 [Araneus ventricosus]
MPWTRAMDEKFEKLFAMMAEMKTRLEDKIEAGQEEMKAGQEEMKAGQEEMKARQEEMKAGQVEMKVRPEEMKAGLEKKMEAGQERMEQVQEEMKDLIRAGKEEMRVDVASQVEGIKDHVDGCIGRMEEEVQGVKGKIEEVKTEVQEKMSDLERRLSDLETRPNNFPTNPEFMYSRPSIKSLTFDGQTSWTVFKTQFNVVSSTNGWTDFVKASQLVASLRGSAAEVLQGIPADKLTDLTTIEKALESRFGDSHLTQFYRTELKTRRQKPGESLQELAADVERLMSLAYAECPLDVRESSAAQYFVDAIRDEDTQHSTRLMDAKDLKSSLAYSMKYEAARRVSKTSRHVRSIETEDHTSRVRDDKFEFFFNRLEELLNSSVAGKKNTPRRNSNVTCWKCNKKGNVQRECQAIASNQEN